MTTPIYDISDDIYYTYVDIFIYTNLKSAPAWTLLACLTPIHVQYGVILVNFRLCYTTVC